MQGNTSAALEYFNNGLEVDDTHTKLKFNRGDLLKSLGRTEEANRDYNNILAIDKDIQSYRLRHNALLSLGRNDKAIDSINQFIEEYPGDNASYYEIAGMHLGKVCMHRSFRRVMHGVNYSLNQKSPSTFISF